MAEASFPEVPLTYLERLTDDFGIWQHVSPEGPERGEGYALDDAARAFWVAMGYGRFDLADVYASFIVRCCCEYREPVNFMSADRLPVRHRGFSKDALGQVWYALDLAERHGYAFPEADRVREAVRSKLLDNGHPRSQAYAALARQPLGGRGYADLCLELLRDCREPGWYWPEPSLNYANALLPLAMLVSGERDGSQEALQEGLRMLDFLNETCMEAGRPIAIGNKGWYPRGGSKALFDQQPIDPAYQAVANLEAYRITDDRKYLAAAREFTGWFWGNNLGGARMVDPETGSCRDGLGDGMVSDNRGAENVVCYLWMQLAWRRLENGV